MPVENPSVADVLQSSLAYQRSRVEGAALNVSRANVPLPAGATAAVANGSGGAAPASSDFARQLGLPPPGTATPSATGGATAMPGDESPPPEAAVRLALEPDNPMADSQGVVRYPAVDLAAEMTTMMSATRAYEATVRAYNLLKSMNGAALEIGK